MRLSTLSDEARRWWAFYLICFGDFMIVLDISIVNVALPAIKSALNFGDTQLAWVVNAYMLTYSGLLLLGGRLGDLYGPRRVFLSALVGFALASLACGLSMNQTMLIIARAAQGIFGAALTAVAFAYILLLFTDSRERIRAMGIFGFIMAGGGAVGVFLGGVITDLLGWQWVFLINVPVGLVVFGYGLKFLPMPAKIDKSSVKLDALGSVLITLAMLIFVYAMINANELGWLSPSLLVLCGVALALMLAFFWWEKNYPQPIMPLSIFRVKNIAPGMVIGGLWSSGMFAAFFMISLNLESIHHYTPLQIGLSFLPANVVMAVVSIVYSGKIIARFGSRHALFAGLLLVAASMVIFALMGEHTSFVGMVLPAMILFGMGGGIAMNPMLYASTAFVPPEENGLASGILNSTFSIGGTLGLSLLVSLAALWQNSRVEGGLSAALARLEGFHLAYWLAAAMCATAALLSLRLANPPLNSDPNAVGH